MRREKLKCKKLYSISGFVCARASAHTAHTASFQFECGQIVFRYWATLRVFFFGPVCFLFALPHWLGPVLPIYICDVCLWVLHCSRAP